MKKMKNILAVLAYSIILLNFSSCTDPDTDSPLFVAQTDDDGIKILITTQGNYNINEEIEDNILERIVWDKLETGVETNVNYEIQLSTDAAFTSENITILGVTIATNYSIKVSQILTIAKKMGLDNDPATEALSVGAVFVRVKSIIGTSEIHTYSDAVTLSFTWIKASVPNPCFTLFIAGDALTNTSISTLSEAGEISCDDGVFERKFAFQTTGTFNLYESSDTASDLGYSYFEDQGYTFETYFMTGDKTSDVDSPNDANYEGKRFSLSKSSDNSFEITGTPNNEYSANNFFTLNINANTKIIKLTASNDFGIGGQPSNKGGGTDGYPDKFKYWENAERIIEVSPDVWTGTVTVYGSKSFQFGIDFYNKFSSTTNIGKYGNFVNDAIGNNYTIDPRFLDASEEVNFLPTSLSDGANSLSITIDAINQTITINP